MASIVRGNLDAQVQALKEALDVYETENPGTEGRAVSSQSGLDSHTRDRSPIRRHT